MRQAADSSIALAAILADYEGHEQAEDALKACTRTIAHAAIETYSVLTRLPPPHRLDGPSAAAIIAARLPPTYATLDATACASATPRLAEAGINGGASYDGLIALTALEHDLELVSRDRRAARTYRALGVRFTLLDGSLAP